ncbi:non-ribosomal peptide synthetase [Nitrosospira briensis]|uniref:non-ribosomal peptide synthetase n=1 Tax=Nitrosospira briensis TaxID=35799 RepID=UPI0008F14804|nr:non-ribosomal peptide synthetase [Nitrosospira briensis]SFO40854.1 amino acid adenylation domain-containing protein [Nitrosospira briensis]
MNSSDLTQRRARLTPEQRKKLAQRLTGANAPARQPNIPRRDSTGPAPLSYAQQRHWFLWQLEPLSTAYHISGGLRLVGKLDIEALRSSFEALGRRHESLRTVFRANAEGLPEQIIEDEPGLDILLIDFSNLSAEQGRVRGYEEANRINATPFDLTQGPLLRLALIRIAPEEHLLVVVMHHIISDAWSNRIVIDEFAAHYRLRVQQEGEGQEPSLPALTIQYADYAVWQRNWLEAGEKDRQLAYWRSQLGEEHPVLQLPTDHPRPSVASYRAGRHIFMLPAGLVVGLQRQAQSQGATLFMALLAGFQALLHRYSGQHDIRVGVPVANRHRFEIENIIGLFVNTQVLRARIDGRMSLKAILNEVREAALGAQTHQDLPFEQLVEALQPERNLNQNPLFQVMYNHLREDYRALERLPGLTVEDHELSKQAAQFELTLDTVEYPDGRLEAIFTYAAELFESATIERLGERYLHLLEQLAGHPERSLGDIDILSEAERGQLRAWGVNDRRYGDTEPVHRLIERQVEARPEAVALIFGDTELSYAELNRRANCLAHRLMSLGVKPETRVGIAVERSIEMVVGLLAILKAGGAYVPLDPEYPRERLDYMVGDSGIGLLLTQSHIKSRIPHSSGCEVLELDVLDLEDEPEGNPQVSLHGQNLAYVIYTSGSTGKPKGVGVPHHALAEHAQVAVGFFCLASSDRMLQFSTINFDGFIEQLFPPLCVGAGVVLRGPMLWDSDTFYHELINKRITVADLTTAYWFLLVQDFARIGPRDYGLLRQVHAGGEAMSPEGLIAWKHAGFDGVTLLNTYGPTEAAVTATACDCSNYSRGNEAVPTKVAIGKPLAGRNIYLLDANLTPVPSGIPGELCIGGDLLARGYLNRGELTAERFIADPFDEEGGRLYRTGDLARWQADGQIEYLGRLDHQVKIRGFRIELGEIEAQLLIQPDVREAVVIAGEGPSGARLVGYVSPHAGKNVDAALMREALAKVLPDYMIPSAIVVLESLPLNPNGKVDRKALPEPEFVGTVDYEAPQGEVEEVLAGIWAQVLGVGQVGRNDNFFELGGDSILSLQIVTKARRAGWKITPRQLFERQTITSLSEVTEAIQEPAEVVARRQRGYLRDYLRTEAISMLAFTDDEIEDIYPLSPTQEGMLFHTLEATGTGLYVNQISVEVEGLEPKRLADAWRAMVARHPVLRTGFLWQAGLARPLQIIFKQVDVPVVHLDWRGLDQLESRIAVYAEEDLTREFNFLAPPLVRLAFIRIADDRYHLIWTKHHILLDGWSDSMLISEWLRCYGGETLVAPGPDYGHYVHWLARQDVQATKVFWQTELRGIEGATILAQATNRLGKRKEGDKRSGFAQIYTRLNPEETLQLKAFAQRRQVTLNTVIQAAWALLLQRYTGKDTVVFGATVAGRPPSLPKADEILGLFINTIPVPVERRSELTVVEYLSLLQKTNARLREHEHASLAEVQRWAGSPGQSLFDSIVVFENYPIDEAMRGNELYGLRFGEVEGKGLTGYAMDLQVVVGEMLEIEYCYGQANIPDEFALEIREHMEFLMREMVAHPQRVIGELGWMEAVKPGHLFSLGSTTRTPGLSQLPHLPVHRLIEQNAVEQPEAIALLMGERELCYGELNMRANRLAHKLVSMGMGPDVRVGVAMERSLEVIVTLLAVLKAGGAYVPLDPEYPAERLSFMIKDSGMSLLLTEEKLLRKLGSDARVRPLALDSLDVTDESSQNPSIPLHEHNLAYIIYTSGSTGLPKGVAVAHGPLSMHCRATAEIYGMTPHSCELLFMSFSFDGAHERWLTALTVGAGLAVRDQELWTAEQTYDALHNYGITNAAFPPAYLGQVAEWAAPRSDPPPVELYVFGGEAMPKASYDLVRKTLRPRILINGYGPTETVVTPLIWKTEASNSFDCAYAPIGRPVGERTAYVLDVDMQPVPVGVVGELYIGGYGLARGYLGRTGLTAERFVADPFDANGRRLYRTGDLVRWLDDGNIEYIGRADHQVKIRGFRIELGEIEACIRELHETGDVAVVVHDGPTGPQLVAYVVPVAAASAAPAQGEATRDFSAELKQQLAKRLPDYMVPAHILMLETLPRLPSGKLNRDGLPEPGAVAGDIYRVPSTPEARLLAQIWQEVLGVERVGETDNFFALGGDSLSSLKVMARMRNVPGAKFNFKLRDLMQRPTIADLLGLDMQAPAETQALLLLNQPGEKAKAEPLFCIHAGFGTVFDYQPLARQLHGKRTVYGLPSRMLANPAHSDTSLAQMAVDYCQIIRQMQPEGPYHLLGWSLGGTLAAMIAASLEAEAQTVAFLGLIDPFIPDVDEPEPDDWRQDFFDFVSVALPGAKIEGVGSVYSNDNLTGVEQPSEEIIAGLLEALILAEQARRGTGGSSSAEVGGYADMGAGELARIFTVARHLKALAAQAPSLSRLNIPPSCWWVAARPLSDRSALARQIDQVEPVSNEINTDHFAIVRASPLLLGIKSALEDLYSQSTFLPT